MKIAPLGTSIVEDLLKEIEDIKQISGTSFDDIAKFLKDNNFDIVKARNYFCTIEFHSINNVMITSDITESVYIKVKVVDHELYLRIIGISNMMPTISETFNHDNVVRVDNISGVSLKHKIHI